MKHRERVEVVKYCKFVDEVLTDTPDIIDHEYTIFYKVTFCAVSNSLYQIDYVVGDEALLSRFPADVKAISRTIQRTEGVTQAMIINRVLRAQETYKQEVAESVTQQALRTSKSNALSSQQRPPQPQQLQGFWRQLGKFHMIT